MNVQPVFNKINKLELLAAQQEPHIFCITEHWATADAGDLISIPGYTLTGSYVRSVRKHGGSAVLCASEFQMHPVSLRNFEREMSFECCAGAFRVNGGRCVCVCIYRSPSSSIE